MRVNTVILKASLWTSVFLLLAAGCKGTGSTAPASEGGNPESAIVIPDAPKGSEIKGARADFYKQAFPQATLFESKDIPAAMIRDLDKGNTNYIVAKDAQEKPSGTSGMSAGQSRSTMTAPAIRSRSRSHSSPT